MTTPATVSIWATALADIKAVIAKAEADAEALFSAEAPVAVALGEKIITTEATALATGDTKDTGKILAADAASAEAPAIAAAEGSIVSDLKSAT